ncbi:peptide/nickel transport system permease protein [Pseudomonas sp. NFR09]|uniref:ABC transporter permease n=1 Tax=Pseudomonas sp. NFR09 TaxID=1566249 RepID=UPI0008B665C3|nr:ABC transporter permease [Pseudomonas sp. NFR09]SET63913.1 peptide/nickel transport system permease protein [Pseudomonas sp. NFR09]
MKNKVSVLVGQRVVLGLLTLMVIAVLIFFGTQLLPGDLAHTILGHQASPEAVAALNRELNLDRPATERFAGWVMDLFHGDLGKSLANGTPIIDLIGERLGNTFFLAGLAAMISVPISVVLGVTSVINKGGWLDRGISWLTLSLISLPDFFLGYTLIFVFSVTLGWLPNLSSVYTGMDFWSRITAVALPCAALVLIVSPHMIRMTRVAILNVLGSPYVEMGYLKGLSSSRVVGIHALANAISPIITVIVLNMAYLVVGVVIIEVVFVYPGIGQLMVDSVSKRDVPVVQACALIFGTTYIVMNIIADTLAMIGNPRIRYSR